MPLILRRADDRGHADHGWLEARHTFSFASYFDPSQMGFRSLRVINQDRIAPGRGFPTHPHRDMEIFSYVVEGELAHEDSMGNGRVLRPGDIQLMSAGSGVTHSEYNPSADVHLHLLQIWIEPDKRDLSPSYTEWRPRPEYAEAADVVVISPDGRDGSAVIHQDAVVRRLKLQASGTVDHEVMPGRGAWLQLIRGELDANGTGMAPGDGACMDDPGELRLVARAPTEALLFDLA
ncbi:MAG: pirin family protein [Planctomycetota bacterium]|nr:pirin family protein [Planctomycetota bacterium]